MKINLKEVDRPFFDSWVLFKEINPQEVLKNGVIQFRCDNHTKTRISTSVKVGESKMGINWPHPHFNTAHKEEYNYLTHKKEVADYFVVSKKQGKIEYLDYIRYLAERLCKQLGIYDQMSVLEVQLIDSFKWP